MVIVIFYLCILIYSVSYIHYSSQELISDHFQLHNIKSQIKVPLSKYFYFNNNVILQFYCNIEKVTEIINLSRQEVCLASLKIKLQYNVSNNLYKYIKLKNWFTYKKTEFSLFLIVENFVSKLVL